MKSLVLALALLTAPALAQSDCSLKQLGACKDSNQLFWSQPASGRARAKGELPAALARFLAGAPKLYIGKDGFTPAQTAKESMTGPGDHHDRQADGSWFFDGFTPHDATDRAATLFNADGTIKAVALLNTDTDTPGAFDGDHVKLRLYGNELTRAQVKLLRGWGGKVAQTLFYYRTAEGWGRTELP
jgi:hypothetical protein